MEKTGKKKVKKKKIEKGWQFYTLRVTRSLGELFLHAFGIIAGANELNKQECPADSPNSDSGTSDNLAMSLIACSATELFFKILEILCWVYFWKKNEDDAEDGKKKKKKKGDAEPPYLGPTLVAVDILVTSIAFIMLIYYSLSGEQLVDFYVYWVVSNYLVTVATLLEDYSDNCSTICGAGNCSTICGAE